MVDIVRIQSQARTKSIFPQWVKIWSNSYGIAIECGLLLSKKARLYNSVHVKAAPANSDSVYNAEYVLKADKLKCLAKY